MSAPVWNQSLPVAEKETDGGQRWWEEFQSLSTLPSVLFRFLGLVGDPSVGVRQLAEFISSDPALMARVLPVIHGRMKINPELDLATSIASLGHDRFRALAFTTPLLRSSEPLSAGSYATTLWERSVLCAHVCRAAARHLKLDHPDHYYLAGLLHDIGYLALLQNRPGMFSAIIQQWGQCPAALLDIETEVIGMNHCELGVVVARNIGLASWLYPAIATHHFPTSDSDQISRITSIGGVFCNWQGLDLFPRDGVSQEARNRDVHEIFRGLLPEISELDRHLLLEVMKKAALPVRRNFHETFSEWFAAGDRGIHPYRRRASLPPSV